MNTVTLGSTGITVKQNAFGALPIQRTPTDEAVRILRRAYEGGMRYFDTARAYSDSEEKLGLAFGDGYIPREDICITAHKIGVAEEAVKSGLYETLQFPFSYLSGQRELDLLKLCEEHNVGFICMKGLAGGLINNSRAAMAFLTEHPWALPIWGIQHMSELEEWLAFMDETPAYDDEIRAFVEGERLELMGDFCRGCGYCMPCPVGIEINNCARMSLMLRRAPSASWLSEHWQTEMAKIANCLHCNRCSSKCPYELDTPALLEKNYADYQRVLAGEVSVD